MKTADPDDVFEDAERMALFSETAAVNLDSKALREVVVRDAPGEAMNRGEEQVWDELELPDSFVLEAGRRILQQNEW